MPLHTAFAVRKEGFGITLAGKVRTNPYETGLWGYRSYRAPGMDKSTNNWFVGIVAWGEGWHNNHHAFPFSARHGLRWFEFDATWWAIKLLSLLRLAGDIKLPAKATLERRALPTEPSLLGE